MSDVEEFKDSIEFPDLTFVENLYQIYKDGDKSRLAIRRKLIDMGFHPGAKTTKREFLNFVQGYCYGRMFERHGLESKKVYFRDGEIREGGNSVEKPLESGQSS